MTLEFQWVFGILFAILMAVLGFAFKQIADLRSDLTAVREKYVRRDDLDGDLNRIDASLKEMKDDIKEVGKTALAVLVAVGKAP